MILLSPFPYSGTKFNATQKEMLDASKLTKHRLFQSTD